MTDGRSASPFFQYGRRGPETGALFVRGGKRVLETIMLSNGAVLLCEPVAGSEAAAVGFWFLHGSRDEGRGEEGFSHFLEHMIFKGTARRTPRQIACEIDRVGGLLNAATEKEVTSVYASVPREHLAVVLDVMCDIAFAAALPEPEIEKEKSVVHNEISSIEDSPEEKGYELFVETMWDGHPLAAKITGTAESVRAIARDQLGKFYRGHFLPGRLVIAVAGGFATEAAAREIEKKIDDYAASVSGPSPIAPADAAPRTPPPFQAGGKVVEDEFSQAQVFFARNFPLPEKVKDYYEHLLLSTAFGESMSSRLFQNIREKEGLCYTVYSSRSYHSDCALFLTYASTLPDQVPRLLEALGRELEQLASAPLTRQEIDEARLQVKGSLILSKQDVEVRMKRLARQYLAMGSIMSYEECFQVIDGVTREDISRLTAELFRPPASALLVYGCHGLKKVKSVIARLPAFQIKQPL
jgi:predicted Zn-dependent peptidase